MENLAKLNPIWKDKYEFLFLLWTFRYLKIFCPCQTRFRIQSCTYSILILWETLHVMEWGRASLWPQQGHDEEDRGWLTQGGLIMTLLQFAHPQIQKIIYSYFMSVSPRIIFLLLSENNLRCIWSHGDFPCRLSQALLSTATFEAISPWLPPHIFPFRQYLLVAGFCLTLAQERALCKHASIIQLSHDPG